MCASLACSVCRKGEQYVAGNDAVVVGVAEVHIEHAASTVGPALLIDPPLALMPFTVG